MHRLSPRTLLPFFVYSALSTAAAAAAVVLGPREPAVWAALAATGFVAWTLFEYLVHRFAFHTDAPNERLRAMAYAMHTTHHERPGSTDELFSSLRTSLPAASVVFVVMLAATGAWHRAAVLFAGFAAGYLVYEFLHYQAHHGRPRTRLFKYLRKYHMLHHHDATSLRFGVTSPLFDLLFGTFAPVGVRAARRRVR